MDHDESISTKPSVNGNGKGANNETIRIEVLEKKIKVDAKQQENEKEKIRCEMKETVNTLKHENENLTINLENKDDKIRQLTIANRKKDSLLEKLNWEKDQLKKREEKLRNEISLREETIRDMSINHKETMEILETQRIEIMNLKERLEEVKTEKDNKDRELVTYIKMMNSKIDDVKKEAILREEKLEQKMDERERKREEDWKQREALRAEEEKRKEQKLNEQLQNILTEVVNVKENNSNPQKDRVFINDAQNLQVGGRNRFFFRQTSCRQLDKVKVTPQTQLSFPPGYSYAQPQPLTKKRSKSKLLKYRP